MEELRAQLAQVTAERDAAVAARDALAGAVREERAAEAAYDLHQEQPWRADQIPTTLVLGQRVVAARAALDDALAAAGGV